MSSELTTVQARVARGAKLLDEAMPDWAGKISLRHLDIRSTSNCILGQLFGYYWDGQNFIQEHTENAVWPGWFEGFSLRDWNSHEDGDLQELDDLHDAWNIEVNARLNKDA